MSLKDFGQAMHATGIMPGGGIPSVAGVSAPRPASRSACRTARIIATPRCWALPSNALSSRLRRATDFPPPQAFPLPAARRAAPAAQQFFQLFPKRLQTQPSAHRVLYERQTVWSQIAWFSHQLDLWDGHNLLGVKDSSGMDEPCLSSDFETSSLDARRMRHNAD